MSRISFWKKDTGNLMNHGTGLSKEQIDFLQSLKEGDRLILWNNDVNGERDKNSTLPHYTMKKYDKNYVKKETTTEN